MRWSPSVWWNLAFFWSARACLSYTHKKKSAFTNPNLSRHPDTYLCERPEDKTKARESTAVTCDMRASHLDFQQPLLAFLPSDIRGPLARESKQLHILEMIQFMTGRHFFHPSDAAFYRAANPLDMFHLFCSQILIKGLKLITKSVHSSICLIHDVNLAGEWLGKGANFAGCGLSLSLPGPVASDQFCGLPGLSRLLAPSSCLPWAGRRRSGPRAWRRW